MEQIFHKVFFDGDKHLDQGRLRLFLGKRQECWYLSWYKKTKNIFYIIITVYKDKKANRDWIERQLAHGERKTMRTAYNYAEYLPERRRMMQEGADYLDELKINTPKNV